MNILDFKTACAACLALGMATSPSFGFANPLNEKPLSKEIILVQAADPQPAQDSVILASQTLDTKESIAWDYVQKSGTSEDAFAFTQAFPDSVHIEAAKALLIALLWSELDAANGVPPSEPQEVAVVDNIQPAETVATDDAQDFLATIKAEAVGDEAIAAAESSVSDEPSDAEMAQRVTAAVNKYFEAKDASDGQSAQDLAAVEAAEDALAVQMDAVANIKAALEFKEEVAVEPDPIVSDLAENEVELRSADNFVSLTGVIISFDDDLITIETSYGVVGIETDGITCFGDACPPDLLAAL